MSEFEFTVDTKLGPVLVRINKGLVILSQPPEGRGPNQKNGDDDDIIGMTISEAREFHRKLGKALTGI